MNEESIHLIDTKGYHENLDKERFSAAGSRCRRRLLNSLIDNFGDLSMTHLMSRFFLMTAHREFPVIHKIIDIQVTADVTTSSNLDMAA